MDPVVRLAVPACLLLLQLHPARARSLPPDVALSLLPAPPPNRLHAGYGRLDPQQWPFWSAVAVAPTFALAANSSRTPKGGCGACLELQCDNSRPGYQVGAVWRTWVLRCATLR